MTDVAMHADQIVTVGIDLGKHIFHLIGMDAPRQGHYARAKVAGRDWNDAWLTCRRVSLALRLAPARVTLVDDFSPWGMMSV